MRGCIVQNAFGYKYLQFSTQTGLNNKDMYYLIFLSSSGRGWHSGELMKRLISIFRTLALRVPVLLVLECWLCPQANFSYGDQMAIWIQSVTSRNDKVRLNQRPSLPICLFLRVWEPFPKALSRCSLLHH